jgi:hypothetical protein
MSSKETGKGKQDNRSKPSTSKADPNLEMRKAIADLVAQKMSEMRDDILSDLKKSQVKPPSAAPRVLGGKKAKKSPSSISSELKRDPRNVEKLYKKATKAFEDPTPKHFVTKDSAGTNMIRDMIGDLERVERSLEMVTSSIDSGIEDDPFKLDILHTLQAVQTLLLTSKARANYKLWKAVASHVAPHVPIQGQMRELLAFWEDDNLNGFTAALQEAEAAQAQVQAMQKLADRPTDAIARRRPGDTNTGDKRIRDAKKDTTPKDTKTDPKKDPPAGDKKGPGGSST